MKPFGILAASSLIGSAMAGIHRMPLRKVPLSDQLVSSYRAENLQGALLTALLQSGHDIDSQVRALGQKYMGIRPQKHEEGMFNTQEIDGKKGHLVPVSVCTYRDFTLGRTC